MATSARRTPASKARTAIPQISWRAPQPAPVVLVSGPEEVCAERAIAGIRDYLRAEDPSLEVTDVRADDYAPGTLLGVTLAVAVRRAAPGARDRRREVLRRLPVGGGVVPGDAAGGRDGHPPPHRRDRARQEAPRRDPRGRGRRASRSRARRSSATPIASTSPPASSRPPRKRIAPVALRTLRLGVRRRSDRARRRVPAAHLRRAGRRHRAGRRAVLRRAGRDLGVRGGRHGDRGPLRRGAHRAAPRAGLRRRPRSARRGDRLEAAHDGARRRQPRVVRGAGRHGSA